MTRLGYAIVFVSDMERSVAFYRDILGFPLKFSSPGWTEFATEGTTLALHPGSVADGEPPTHAQAPAGRCRLGFWVDDMENFHQEMLAKGIPCLQPPKEEHGMKLAEYVDPDGLSFSVAGRPKT